MQLDALRLPLLTLLTLGLFSSCVSVTLKTDAAAKISNEIEYQNPAPPFEALKKSRYPTWFNKQSGHSISIISDCRDDDFTIDQLRNEALSSFDELKTNRFENFTLTTQSGQDFPGQKLFATGLTNMQHSQISSFIFKRGRCNYTTVLAGKEASFNAQEAIFNDFLKTLKVK